MTKVGIGQGRHTATRAGLVLLVTLGMLASMVASAGAMDTTPARATGTLPRTDGTNVVYHAFDGSDAFDAYHMSRANWSPELLVGGAGNRPSPDIDNGVAVWSSLNAQGNFDIEGKNLATGAEFTVSDDQANEFWPAISGTWVVWVAAAAGSNEVVTQTLMARDIASTADPIALDEVPIGPGGGGFLRPAISGNRVAWVRMEQTSTHSASWQLKTRRIGVTPATVVAEDTIAIAGPSAQVAALAMPGYDVANDMLVYTFNLNLWVVDLNNDVRTLLASTQDGAWKPARNPTTDGRYIFWQDYRSAANLQELYDGVRFGTLRSDIAGYDTLTGSEFPVATNRGYNSNPHTRGGTLVYQQRPQYLGEGDEIHAAPLSQVVPSAAMPNPGKTDPNWIYFPLTGHYVAYGFKTFWEQSGGIPVFGYSLTEEFTEYGLTVQYFERQRFEYHPEHAGTPYETELGRLGYERAAALTLLGTKPFQATPSGLYGSNADCVYFPETGHHLCASFKSYWQSHGLEFGDPGYSFRESLALFGYPISEEYVDPQTGLTVQYFERARFEWHPNNPEPYKVLLGRLGSDLLSERGW